MEVRSDARGIPHIYADNPLDLFRAQGYISAQDRFFEMDLRRHITSGRLAELVGSAGLETDKVTRTLGWRRVAEKELALIAPATRSISMRMPRASTTTSTNVAMRPRWAWRTRSWG